jgi:spore germination protein KB
VCAAAVRGGLESYARSTQFLIPPAFFILLVTLTFTVKDWHPENMLPILEDGIGPSLKGATLPMIWFSDFFLASYLLPHLSNREKAVPWGVAAIIGAMVTLVLINLVSLFVFGTQTITYTFPYFEVFRYISLGQFVERIDSFLLAIWVVLIFVKVSCFHYKIVLSVAQWLGLSDYRFLSLPWAVILVVFGIWTAPSFPYYIYFFSTKVFIYSHLIHIVIPSILLVIAWIRNRNRSENGRKSR